MRIHSKDLSKGYVKLEVNTLDDLWYLSHIISEGDLVRGKTTRKIKIGNSSDGNVKVIKKTYTLQLQVTKVEFHKYTNLLRISGKITQAPDDIPIASFHTITIEDHSVISLTKQHFLSYQIEKLNEAEKGLGAKILLVVLDREEAIFADMKKYGYEIITRAKGTVAKKDQVSVVTNFYEEVLTIIKGYDERKKYESIVVASPGFFKEDFAKNVKDENIKKKLVLATVSSVSEPAFAELLKRDEVKSALKQDKIAKEVNLVNEVMVLISKEGNVSYGLKETENAVLAGAVNELILSEDLILKFRKEENFAKIEEMMKTVDRSKGHIHIISSDHEAGQMLDGLGGIAAKLRYKL